MAKSATRVLFEEYPISLAALQTALDGMWGALSKLNKQKADRERELTTEDVSVEFSIKDDGQVITAYYLNEDLA